MTAERDEDADESIAADWNEASGGAPEAAAAASAPPDPRAEERKAAEQARLAKSGILAIVNSNDVSYERLPMLEVVFDRLERILTTSVRNFTAENVDINLENITAQRFGDYLNSISLPAMISVFQAMEWENAGLITVDSSMIYSIVDVLLGGRRGTLATRVEGRPFTTIEASLIERLTRLILHDLGMAFAPITPVHFCFERMETNPRFAAIARPDNACVIFKLRIDMQERGGEIEFVIPYATLEPVRDLLLQGFMGEKFGRDTIWENHLAREILQTEVDLEAVLDEHTMLLREVAGLEVGSVLPLNARQDSRVRLRCGSVAMLEGRIGRIGDHLAIEVEEKLDPPEGGRRD
ncbi:MAG: flagellar motor switch protein FliM [Geminicoccaceae bacterium]|nr:flagellar motor switch protein FliM [Geminicoccaceae bacterium]